MESLCVSLRLQCLKMHQLLHRHPATHQHVVVLVEAPPFHCQHQWERRGYESSFYYFHHCITTLHYMYICYGSINFYPCYTIPLKFKLTVLRRSSKSILASRSTSDSIFWVPRIKSRVSRIEIQGDLEYSWLEKAFEETIYFSKRELKLLAHHVQVFRVHHKCIKY